MPLPVKAINIDVLQRLAKLYASGRLGHAYLFTGPRGIGKLDTALAVAQAVNCLELSGFKPGCRCVSCRKIDDGNHPDLFIIEKPEDKTEIVIGQITPRANESYSPLLPWLSVKALEARVRVVIIKDADVISSGAANAFLKTLEEPRPGTLLILTSAAPGNILRTVISRCHEVRFFPQGNSVLAGRLKNEYDIPLSSAGILARFSGGSPGRAEVLGKKFIAEKNVMINEFILGPSNESVLKKWSADKGSARELLEVVLTFYHDVLCVKSGAEDGAFYNVDRAADIRKVAARLAVEDIQAILDQAVKAIEATGETFNVKVALTLLKELIG